MHKGLEEKAEEKKKQQEEEKVKEREREKTTGKGYTEGGFEEDKR